MSAPASRLAALQARVSDYRADAAWMVAPWRVAVMGELAALAEDVAVEESEAAVLRRAAAG